VEPAGLERIARDDLVRDALLLRIHVLQRHAADHVVRLPMSTMQQSARKGTARRATASERRLVAERPAERAAGLREEPEPPLVKRDVAGRRRGALAHGAHRPAQHGDEERNDDEDRDLGERSERRRLPRRSASADATPARMAIARRPPMTPPYQALAATAARREFFRQDVGTQSRARNAEMREARRRDDHGAPLWPRETNGFAMPDPGGSISWTYGRGTASRPATIAAKILSQRSSMCALVKCAAMPLPRSARPSAAAAPDPRRAR
jgi:hypothetical protein